MTKKLPQWHIYVVQALLHNQAPSGLGTSANKSQQKRATHPSNLLFVTKIKELL
jgi:hypothetical protein